MKSTTLFILLITQITLGQYTIPEITKLGPNIRLESGIYMPLGTFAKTIDPSPSFGLIGGIKLSKKLRLDPQLMFFIPQSRTPVLIDGDEGIVSGRINLLSGNIGATLNRVFILNKNSLFEIRGGTGVSILQTDRKKENTEDCDNDQFYGSETIFLKTGIGFKTRILKYNFIGIEINYLYTPYNLFKPFVSSIGNQALSLSVSYGI